MHEKNSVNFCSSNNRIWTDLLLDSRIFRTTIDQCDTEKLIKSYAAVACNVMQSNLF